MDSGFGPSPQEHWIKARDSIGCWASDTIKVSILDTPSPQLSSDTSLCPDDSLLLDPGDFFYYEWSTGKVDSSIWVTGDPDLPTDPLSVTVYMTNGCSGKDSIHIQSLTEPSVQLPPDTSLCASDSLLLSSSAPSPTWDDGTTNSYHVVDSSHAGLGKSIHWLHSINASGCKDRASILVDISICNKLKEHEKKPSVKVIPNPASEQVRVQPKAPRFRRDVHIELYDPEGRKLLQKEGSKGKKEVFLDVSELASGNYFLFLRNERSSFVKKLIVN